MRDLMHTPSKPPPPGVTPDFAKRSPLLDLTIAVSAVFLTLMYFFLGVRLFMRRIEQFRSDDSMAVFSALCTTAFAGIVLLSVQNMGKHSWDIPLGFIASAASQKSMVAQHALNGITLFLGKLCVLTMYHRVFGHIQKIRIQLIITLILALPLLAATIIRPVMVAPPAGKPWGTMNPAIKGADIPGLMIGIDNIVVDACLAWIPVPVIWGLRLEGGRKKGVLALFGTGGIAVIADIIILYYRIMVLLRTDNLIYCYIAHNCSLIEATISVILSSLPAFAKFWRIYISPSPFLHSLRLRFLPFSSSSDDSGTVHRSLPTFIKEAGGGQRQGQKRRMGRNRDPYSVGLTSKSHLAHEEEGERQQEQREKWDEVEGGMVEVTVVVAGPPKPVLLFRDNDVAWLDTADDSGDDEDAR